MSSRRHRTSNHRHSIVTINGDSPGERRRARREETREERVRTAASHIVVTVETSTATATCRSELLCFRCRSWGCQKEELKRERENRKDCCHGCRCRRRRKPRHRAWLLENYTEVTGSTVGVAIAPYPLFLLVQ